MFIYKKWKSLSFLIFFFCAGAFFFLSFIFRAEAQNHSAAYAKGRLIVKMKMAAHETLAFDPTDRRSRLYQINRKHKVKGFRRLIDRHQLRRATTADEAHEEVYLVNVPEDCNIEEAVADYAEQESVIYAQPDYIVKKNVVFNDPGISSQWAIATMQLEQAWDISQGAGVVIAINDSGIDYTHEDLAANMWNNPGEIPGNGVDDDGNGFVDDVFGWDFANDDNDPLDGDFHGTHVAGIAAAVGNNGEGIAGVAPQAQLMALKGLDDEGSGFSSDLAAGIIYAALNGARIVNNSWGCSDPCPFNPIVEDAVEIAHGLNTIVVMASGNEGDDVQNYSPQNMAETITVAASSPIDTWEDFSNFGQEVDVIAPGTSILSTIPGDSYAFTGGTSMAAPQVAGLAALILSQHPEFTHEEVRQVIRASADEFDAPGFDILSGHGRINAYQAVQIHDPLLVAIDAPAQDASIDFSNILIQVEGSVLGTSLDEYSIEAKAADPLADWKFGSGPFDQEVNQNFLGDQPLFGFDVGAHFVKVSALSTEGFTFEDIVEVNFTGIPLPNQPPTVDVGADMNVTLPDTINLVGIVNDDGLPDPPSNMTFTWSQVSGPGVVTFSNPNVPITTASFSTDGTYVLRLTANDGELQGSDDVTVLVNPALQSELLSQSGWALVFVSSFHPSREGPFAFDGNPNTWWHSKWQGAPETHPHEIIIDMGVEHTLTGFTYLPRPLGTSNGTIRDYEFYVSTDGQNWGVPVKSGTWAGQILQEETFAAKNGRFIRLRALSEVNGNVYGAVAELNVLGISGGPPPPNQPPVAQNDTATTTEDIAVQIPVLNNDSDSDGTLNVSSVVIESQGGSGVATVNASGVVTYTPNASTIGIDTFTYTVEDNDGDVSNVATVTVTINESPLGEGGIISQDGWTLVSVSSFHPSREGPFAFDGNPNTWWHSKWQGAAATHPHEIIIDMGQEHTLTGFTYLPRPQGNSNGTIRDYEFYVSADGQNWGVPVKSGTWSGQMLQEETFTAKNGRFIRLRALSEINGNVYGAVAELNVIGDGGAPPPPPPTDMLVPQDDWILQSVSSFHPSREGPFAFDGNPNTWWHSKWQGTPETHPHEIIIDLGANYTLTRFSYLSRPLGNSNGTIKDFEFYVSSDGVNWGAPAHTGTWSGQVLQEETLSQPTFGRYIRLVALSEINGNPYGAVAELNVYAQQP